MTCKEIARLVGPIREREVKATPGPWALDENYQCYIWGPNMQMVADDGGDEEGTLIRMRGVGANLPLKTNGQFIAAARTDIPALCDALEATGKELEEVLLLLEEGWGNCPVLLDVKGARAIFAKHGRTE